MVGHWNFDPMLSQCPNVVSGETNEHLTADVTMEEVRRAAFRLGAFKSPRPDGINDQFYPNFWEIIKKEVYEEVEEFFYSRSLNPELNRTHISLVPKSQNPESSDKYRFISLCNFSYKIISRVMVNRLKPWLPNIIVGEQSAFVGRRQVQDNILIVQEVLHQLRVQKERQSSK